MIDFILKIFVSVVTYVLMSLPLWASEESRQPNSSELNNHGTDIAVYFDMPSVERDSSIPFEKDTDCEQLKGAYCFLGLDSDGLVVPMHSGITNENVIVFMVSTEGDSSVPSKKEAYHCQDEFLGGCTNPCHKLNVDYKVVIENHSPYPYVVRDQWMASGYDSLELDFLTSDNKILTARKRMPRYLSDRLPYSVLKSDWRWMVLVSLDPRLWQVPNGFAANLITHVRPRFAFGCFLADGKCYRTLPELKTRSPKKRTFRDREGELVGEWMVFKPQQRCWSFWK